MKVTVCLLGGLRHYFGGEEEILLELDPSTTVRELAARLNIPESEIMQVIIAGLRKDFQEEIGETDRIEILPTLVGG